MSFRQHISDQFPRLYEIIIDFRRYYDSFIDTTAHTFLAVLCLPIAFFVASIFPLAILLVPVLYLSVICIFYLFSDLTEITTECIPTKIEGGNRIPDTEAKRNKEIRFFEGEATVHTSVEVIPSRESFCIRFETPVPLVQAELRGPPVAEQTYEPTTNELLCDEMTIHSFDPIIDLYTAEDSSLTGGDYYLRIFDSDTENLLCEHRLVEWK